MLHAFASASGLYGLNLWAGILGGFAAVFVLFATLGRWVLKRMISWAREELTTPVAAIREQVTPNGGSSPSLGDTVMRIEQRQREMRREMDKAKILTRQAVARADRSADRIEQHIGWHRANEMGAIE